jgi:hypothetical protein
MNRRRASMGFRFYAGTPPVVHTTWKCPTCGTANTGPLEEGCAMCKVGADATPAQAALPQTGDPIIDPVYSAFLTWAETLHDVANQTLRQHGEAAFRAGAAWATGNRTPLPAPLPVTPSMLLVTPAIGAVSWVTSTNGQPPITSEGGWMLAMVPPDTHEPTLIDQRTQATVLAALMFYRDNQLGYGAVPGQLSAQECAALIVKLTPRDSEEVL